MIVVSITEPKKSLIVVDFRWKSANSLDCLINDIMLDDNTAAYIVNKVS